MPKLVAKLTGILGSSRYTRRRRRADASPPDPPPTDDGEHRLITEEKHGYQFYWRNPEQSLRHEHEAAVMSAEILNPARSDPNFLVLEQRRRIFTRWISELPPDHLRVLDVGGRLKPYRPLLEGRLDLYVGLDPILEGLVDVVGVGEDLPFADSSFDLVICTQALNYAPAPARVIAETRRVLVPGGWLFLSVPAIFPRYHDQLWRFMPTGLKALLSDFGDVEVVAEDGSIAGFARSLNLFIDTFVQSDRPKRVARRLVYPAVNRIGARLDRLSGPRTEFATNYSCRARKVPLAALAAARSEEASAQTLRLSAPRAWPVGRQSSRHSASAL